MDSCQARGSTHAHFNKQTLRIKKRKERKEERREDQVQNEK